METNFKEFLERIQEVELSAGDIDEILNFILKESPFKTYLSDDNESDFLTLRLLCFLSDDETAEHCNGFGRSTEYLRLTLRDILDEIFSIMNCQNIYDNASSSFKTYDIQAKFIQGATPFLLKAIENTFLEMEQYGENIFEVFGELAIKSYTNGKSIDALKTEILMETLIYRLADSEISLELKKILERA